MIILLQGNTIIIAATVSQNIMQVQQKGLQFLLRLHQKLRINLVMINTAAGQEQHQVKVQAATNQDLFAIIMRQRKYAAAGLKAAFRILHFRQPVFYLNSQIAQSGINLIYVKKQEAKNLFAMHTSQDV